MTSTNDSVTTSASEHLLGRVKWFNNKSGYGFITITDGHRSGSDIFVHHSAINVENQQYKYLVQGEYVEFAMTSSSGKHEFQATNVSGVRGGKLMCETKRELKIARSEYKTQRTSDEPSEVAEPKTPRQRVPQNVESSTRQRKTAAPRVRGEGPRDGEKKEWTLVSSKTEQKPKVRRATKAANSESK
jgi:CspA family cold shock protein